MDKATNLFVDYIKTKYDLLINDELVWEAITMYRGELDHELFPIDNLEKLHKHSILSQVTLAILAQANQLSRSVLRYISLSFIINHF